MSLCLQSLGLSLGSINVSSGTVTPPSPDTTSPVISNTTWDDGTDTATFDLTEGGTLRWAIYLAADGAPTLNSNGTWTGLTQETGAEAVTDGAVTLTLTPATVVGDRVTYGVIDAAGNVSNVISNLAITLTQTPPISITENPDATITINGDGAADITITWPPEYMGSYALTASEVANLATTPINAVAPTITGNNPGTVGDAYALEHPGLWFFDGVEPTVEYIWRRDGSAVGSGATYTTVQPGSLRLRENYNGQSATSTSIVVNAPASSFEASEIASGAQSTTASPVIAIADLSMATEFWLTFSRNGQEGNPVITFDLDGQPGASMLVDGAGSKEQVHIIRFTGVTGNSGNLTVTDTGTNVLGRDSYAIHAITSGTGALIASDVHNSDADGATVSLQAAMAPGQLALFGAVDEFNGGSPPFATTGMVELSNVSQNNRGTLVGDFEATTSTTHTMTATGNVPRRKSGLMAVVGAA